jgi:SIR2-like domain
MPDVITSPATTTVLRRSEALDEAKWDCLLLRISKQKCTPFLGPETCFDFSIPSASVLADEWAEKHNYPFDDRRNLARVSQYVAYNVYENVRDAKAIFAKKFHGLKSPDFCNPDEPYRILASLPLKVYINTHYFAFMSRALMSLNKEPHRIVCRSTNNESLKNESDLETACDPTPACPLVYHMFGNVDDPESLVLTEDDYLDFLVRTSYTSSLIPDVVQGALVNNSLLFFGYQTNDLDFRVILRTLARIWRGPSQASSYTIQFVHVSDEKVSSEQVIRLKDYFNRYCKASMSIGVYWGTTSEFMIELRQRWEDYIANDPTG